MNKKDIYWFTHDTNAKDDPKCAMMIEQFGPEAYGIFWILIEILREQPDFSYPLALIPSIARKYNTTKDKVLAVISGYGLFDVRDDKFFYSRSLIQRTIEFKEKKDHKTAMAIKAALARWEKEREKQALQITEKVDSEGNDSNAEECGCNANAMRMQCKRNADAMPINKINKINNNILLCPSSPNEKQDEQIESDNLLSFEEDTTPKNLTPEELREMWNEGCGTLPKVRALSPDRIKKAKLRIAEFGKTREEQTATMREIMSKVAASRFLHGESGGSWKASFVWLITNSDNWLKVIEGSYDNNKQSNDKYSDDKWNR